MKEQNMPRADFVMSLFLLAFGIAATVLSAMMPRMESQHINPYSVPGLVPGFLGIVIVLLGSVMLIRSISRGGFRLGLAGSAFQRFFAEQETRRILLTIVLGAGYGLILLGRMHFILSTGIFVFAFVFLFEIKKGESLIAQWKTVFWGAILAIVTSVSVYAVFTYLFLVNLP
jgi:putative tricarboxylic transport membrane protein